MKISRRGTVQGGALAATGAVMGNPLRAWAQLEGSRTPTGGSHPVPSIQDTESPAQNAERMKWFREARFGMFIHWGLYAIPAGRWDGQKIPGIGEWIMNAATIPVADYKALAPKFNPTQFSAAKIVGLAKAAGMKYIVITSKHHDGFAMFDSKANPFNIVQATPFKRDPLKELAAECRNQGIKLGFYHSQDQDWTAPGGAALPHGQDTSNKTSTSRRHTTGTGRRTAAFRTIFTARPSRKFGNCSRTTARLQPSCGSTHRPRT